ncbi:MAG TPA: hypothetical protein VLF40_04865 [Candidatus Saccharimonadales bacterium]|nr:hypothetical protein [Candidatus Saccharimonadales bacterium]
MGVGELRTDVLPDQAETGPIGFDVPAFFIDDGLDPGPSDRLQAARVYLLSSPEAAEHSLLAYDPFNPTADSIWHDLVNDRSTRTSYWFDDATMAAIDRNKDYQKLRRTTGEDAQFRLRMLRLQLFLNEVKTRRQVGATALDATQQAAEAA